MPVMKSVAIASILAAGFGLTAPAHAGDATRLDCIQMSRLVNAALAASPNRMAAARQVHILIRNGSTMCSRSDYDRGVAYYKQALDALAGDPGK
jgi:hypothetical protein